VKKHGQLDGVINLELPYDLYGIVPDTKQDVYFLNLTEISISAFEVNIRDLREGTGTAEERAAKMMSMSKWAKGQIDKAVELVEADTQLPSGLEMTIVYLMFYYTDLIPYHKTEPEPYKGLKLLLAHDQRLIFPSLAESDQTLETITLLYQNLGWKGSLNQRVTELGKRMTANEAETAELKAKQEADVRDIKAKHAALEAEVDKKADKKYVDRLFAFLLLLISYVPELIKKKGNQIVHLFFRKTSEIDAKVTSNTAKIIANKENIETNAANIETNAASIETNAATIETNAANIETNAANIETNAATIETNAANVDYLGNHSEEMSMRVGYMSDKNQAVLAGMKNNIAELQGNVANQGNQAVKQEKELAKVKSVLAVVGSAASAINDQDE